MTATPEELVQRAIRAERTGRFDEAGQLWGALRQAFPSHPKALFFEGRQRIERGDFAGAQAVLAQAEAGDRSDPEIPLFLSLTFNMQGALPQALAALERALAIDPYFFAAQLSKGAVLERMGQPRAAARTYRNALKIAPAPERLPPSLRAPYERAKTMVAENAQALAAHLRDRTAQARANFAGEKLDRFDECLDILAGVRRRQFQDPILLYFPQLPPIPYYDRALFPWLAQLEAATDMIREELAVVLREDQAKFAPYIQMPPGAPVNQWVELNHSSTWSTFFMWRDGVRQHDNCARCPRTSALLEGLPMAHQPGYGPTAMFSVLAPRITIPPHTGSSNTRLIVHLPLVLPDGCRFRVGNETRDWRMGEAWVFDDTIEHEAWNDSDQVRTILIFDVWNPMMSVAERDMVSEMMTALNEYDAGA